MKKNNKKIAAGVLAAAMILGMTGCGSTQSTVPAENAGLAESAGMAALPSEAVSETPDVSGDEVINLYFVRHGKTILNTLDRVQGWSDSPLTPAGAEVAQNAAYGLAEVPFDLVYASDRVRALETADIILAANPAGGDRKINKLAGLREHNYGKYEGDLNQVMWGDIMNHLGVADFDELFQLEDTTRKIYDAVAELDETGEAEDYEDVSKRLMASIESIIEAAESDGIKNVLVVGHGGAIGVILSQIGNISVGELGNASVSLVEYRKGAYQVISVGDMSYSEKGELLRRDSLETEMEQYPSALEGEETGEVIIYLTSHGKTVYNTMGRTQGWTDSPLTAAGVEIAQNLGRSIADIEFTAAYCSDMGRTVETAEIVLGLSNTSKDLPVIEKTGLRETYYGKFEGGINADMLDAALIELGLSGIEELSELENGIAAVIDTIHKLDETGEAENYQMMSQRVNTAFDGICRETAINGGGNVLVVAHGNAIMAVLNSIGNANILEIDNASISKIRYSNGVYTIESINDTSYIKELQ